MCVFKIITDQARYLHIMNMISDGMRCVVGWSGSTIRRVRLLTMVVACLVNVLTTSGTRPSAFINTHRQAVYSDL